jgi:hypothetical protein
MDTYELLRLLDGLKALQQVIVDLKEKTQPVNGLRTSEKTEFLYEALAKAQAEFKIAEHDKKGQRNTYASPSALLNAVKPALNKYGLAIAQPIVWINNQRMLLTHLSHSSGQFMEGSVPLQVAKESAIKDDNQAFGATHSYQMRYCLRSFLGISTGDEEDLDDIVPQKPLFTKPLNKF